MNKKNICFVCNHGKTLTFYRIGEYLKKNGHEISWISTNLNLIEKYKLTNCLNIGTSQINNFPGSKSFRNEYKILYADRNLNYQSNSDMEYLRKVFYSAKIFLKSKKVDYVFGEFSWAHELTIFEVCEDLGIKYFYPAPNRVDDDDFLFINHYFQNTLAVSYQKNKISKNYKKKSLHYPEPKITKKIKNFFLDNYYAKDDVCRKSKTSRFLNFLLKKIRKIRYRIFFETIKFTPKSDKRYFIYFLHKSPEAGIDIKGMFYEDELKNIVSLSRIMNINDILIVKEHPRDVGNKNSIFYNTLKKLPNIFLVDEFDKSIILEKDFDGFISISGTILLDMSLKGKPCLTFADNWFNFIPWIKKLSYDDFRYNNIDDLIKPVFQPNAILIKKIHKLLSNISYSGDVNDFESYPDRDNKKNIKKIVKSFETLFSSHIIKNLDDLKKDFRK